MEWNKSWIVKNSNNQTLYETLTETEQLELAKHFVVGEWKTVQMQPDSLVIWLLKQEDFCGAIAFT